MKWIIVLGFTFSLFVLFTAWYFIISLCKEKKIILIPVLVLSTILSIIIFNVAIGIIVFLSYFFIKSTLFRKDDTEGDDKTEETLPAEYQQQNNEKRGE